MELWQHFVSAVHRVLCTVSSHISETVEDTFYFYFTEFKP